MKQHITVEQFNELSEKGREKFINWQTNKGYSTGNELYDMALPPSIGQMIEFLDENKETILFITKIKCGDKEEVWSTGSLSCMGSHTQDKKESKRLHKAGFELCNSLWEAVKEVLEK